MVVAPEVAAVVVVAGMAVMRTVSCWLLTLMLLLLLLLSSRDEDATMDRPRERSDIQRSVGVHWHLCCPSCCSCRQHNFAGPTYSIPIAPEVVADFVAAAVADQSYHSIEDDADYNEYYGCVVAVVGGCDDGCGGCGEYSWL